MTSATTGDPSSLPAATATNVCTDPPVVSVWVPSDRTREIWYRSRRSWMPIRVGSAANTMTASVLQIVIDSLGSSSPPSTNEEMVSALAASIDPSMSSRVSLDATAWAASSADPRASSDSRSSTLPACRYANAAAPARASASTANATLRAPTETLTLRSCLPYVDLRDRSLYRPAGGST